MQNQLEISQESQDERANSIEDSPMMTIDYLRARLLSERLVSKAAKERANELARRVEDLEQQLKLVTFQRKRAGKATLEILSLLANHGISDISEVYESDSDQEDSLCESNEGKCDGTQEDENFGPSEVNGDNMASGSDHDSTTSSGRTLSWKGRNEVGRPSDKKYSDISVRRRTRSTNLGSSPRHYPGKSCRQIKRREMRSVVDKSRHDSANPDAQDNRTLDSSEKVSNSLDARTELGKFPEKLVERVVQKNEVSHSSLPQAQEGSSKSPVHKHECSGEMEKALECQAQLIGRYEAQEKAQRDWEEKYGENNISTLDACEPGNHSDVTEERDENKATVPLPIEEVDCHEHELKTKTKTYFNSKESSIHCIHNFNETQTSPSRSLAPDFSFSMSNSYQVYERGVPPSFHSSQHISPQFSQSASILNESEIPRSLNTHCELVSKKEPQRLGAILGALEEAKLVIKQQMNGSPLTSSVENSDTQIKDAAWLKGCPGLFRVPTNVESQPSMQTRLTGLNCTSELTNSSLYSRAPLSQHDGYISSPSIDVPKAETFSDGSAIDSDRGISTGQPRFEFAFNTITSQTSSSELASPAYPSFPDFFHGNLSKQMSFNPVPRDRAWIPPSGSTLSYGHDIRPHMYR